MKNVLITGSGRSGTSMVAGLFSKSGYFMGEASYPPRYSNPKGFFEDVEVNEINETLLAQVVPGRPAFLPMWIKTRFFRNRPMHAQRWLAALESGLEFRLNNDISERITVCTQKQPFCYKDPRFSYTLSVWRPFLENAVYICVFRSPGDTALSIVRECQREEYLKSLTMDFDRAIHIWTSIYKYILKEQIEYGDWMFVHYDQVVNGNIFRNMESFTGATIDSRFPDAALNRSKSMNRCPSETEEVYKRLCKLADYQPNRELSNLEFN